MFIDIEWNVGLCNFVTTHNDTLDGIEHNRTFIFSKIAQKFWGGCELYIDQESEEQRLFSSLVLISAFLTASDAFHH